MKSKTIRIWLAILLSGTAWGQAWPRKLSSSSGTGKYQISGEAPRFKYRTKTFKIESSLKHDHGLMTEFVKAAESVPLVLRSLPLPLYSPPQKAGQSLLIASDDDSYERASGAKNTAGYYDGKVGQVIINWPLFKNDTVQTRILQEPAFDLIVHELTHLSMHGIMWKTEAWFTEGVAEYLAASHTGKGSYDFTRIDQAIRKRILKHTPPDSQKKVKILKLETLVGLSSQDWLDRTAELKAWQILETYKSALLLTHYAFHGGSERRSEVKRYLEKIHSITSHRENQPKLFSRIEAQKIETLLAAYWKKKGLALTFAE